MTDEALEQMFGDQQEELARQFEVLCERRRQSGYPRSAQAFIKSSIRGTDGIIYTRFRDVTQAELADRAYRWEHWDHQVSVHWLDVQFDPVTRTTVPAPGRETYAQTT
jgi:hypothetical protein